MIPQGVQSISNPSSSYRPEVQHAVEYGNGMEQAARKFQMIILAAWGINTVLIFTHRLLNREKPLGFQVNHPITGDKIYEKTIDIELTDRQKLLVRRLDNILFTVSYTLLSFLMALQFFPYGKVTVQ